VELCFSTCFSERRFTSRLRPERSTLHKRFFVPTKPLPARLLLVPEVSTYVQCRPSRLQPQQEQIMRNVWKRNTFADIARHFQTLLPFSFCHFTHLTFPVSEPPSAFSPIFPGGPSSCPLHYKEAFGYYAASARHACTLALSHPYSGQAVAEFLSSV
jgi:hypothetical protein